MATTITLTADEYDALLAERERLAHQLRAITVERARIFAPIAA